MDTEKEIETDIITKGKLEFLRRQGLLVEPERQGTFLPSGRQLQRPIPLPSEVLRQDAISLEIDVVREMMEERLERIKMLSDEERRRAELEDVRQEVRETLDVSDIKETAKSIQKEIEDEIGFSVPTQMLEIQDDNDFVETLRDSYPLLTPQEVKSIVSKRQMGQRGRRFRERKEKERVRQIFGTMREDVKETKKRREIMGELPVAIAEERAAIRERAEAKTKKRMRKLPAGSSVPPWLRREERQVRRDPTDVVPGTSGRFF
jgi:hypothetical protein